jgi:ABC-type multidrug transport system ATPase subunit
MSEAVLSTHQLTKQYGRRTVVGAVSMTVRRGDIYGFLGPNGAGKTTTLRMVTGLIRPTSGGVRLLGQDAGRAPRTLMAKVGSLIEGPAFYPHLSAGQNLDLVQRMKGSAGGRPEVADLLDLVGLSKTGTQAAHKFSLGMKQRLGIAMALVGAPELLVLDEPTNGLDPEGFRDIRALLRRLVAERNLTVLLSSHLLAEVEQVATRVGVIRDGHLLVESTVDALRGSGGQQVLEVAVSHPEQGARLIRERLRLAVDVTGPGEILVRGAANAAEVNALLVRNDLAVTRLVEHEPTLEQIFFHLTGGNANVTKRVD